MVGDGQRRAKIEAQSRRVLAFQIPEHPERPGLIDRCPVSHPIAEPAADHIDERSEVLHDAASEPAAAVVLQRLRQIPVVERQEWGDASLEQSINQARVEVEPGFVDAASTFGHDSRPGDRKTIGVQVELAHELDVFPPSMVVIAGDVAGLIVDDVSGVVGEGIPDTWPTPVFSHGTFDLVRRRGSAPVEAVWEVHETPP